MVAQLCESQFLISRFTEKLQCSRQCGTDTWTDTHTMKQNTGLRYKSSCLQIIFFKGAKSIQRGKSIFNL